MSAKLKKFRAASFRLEGLELSIGKVTKPPAEEEFAEPMGPTPKPGIEDLRDWDMILLKRYPPMYAPICDVCCLCTYGKCDLTGNKKGACGIDMKTQQGRWSLLTAFTGMSTHLSHAKELVEKLIEMKGPDVPIEMGEKTPVEAPIIRVVTGIAPKKLSDLLEVIDYVESQVPPLVASIHMGQEGSYLDYESKAYHAGMLDSVSMEVADIAQICALDLPRGDPNAPLVEIGAGVLDQSKPVILVIGHNVLPAISIADYMREHDLEDKIEIGGICCTAIDLTRYTQSAKIVGPQSMQIKYVRSGFADVVIVDEQCIRVDMHEIARSVNAPFIATNIKAMHGLPDRTHDDPDEIVKDLVSGKETGVLILDEEKVGEIAVRVALEVAPKRQKFKITPSKEEVIAYAKTCWHCGACTKTCPNSLPISDAMYAAAEGDLSKLAALEESCVGCGRCEQECKRKIPVLSLIAKAAEKKFREQKAKARVGRGPISDYEIRIIAEQWGLGTIPGCIAIIGCCNYPNEQREVYEMAKELLMRNFIVAASGCGAMSIGLYTDEEGKTLYERFPGAFVARGLCNVGSCVSNPHITDAGIRVANVFARRILSGNFKEIADYLLNYVGACGLVWGAYSQKAFSIGMSCHRLGVPAVLGPHSAKYRHLYLGLKENLESYNVRDIKDGSVHNLGPVPEHLIYVAESMEEAMVMCCKLCFRNNDLPEGRQLKVTNYIDIYKKYYGRMPDDLHYYIRDEFDIPYAARDEIMELLKAAGWEPKKPIKSPTLLDPKEIWTYEAMRQGKKWYTV
ncbi:MAG: CO dehydrogenase/acetyl-CoA synthase complex subunit epsilon [Candidatus Syntrophoarchaeum sp. WYZ-LMO15]|nr:MAG: CO dehydrogenase/acetyl-CoA synthase complex subunit epsilon [Candidatus Syntrophoarchaeum sp. WYZ-LMO15]